MLKNLPFALLILASIGLYSCGKKGIEAGHYEWDLGNFSTAAENYQEGLKGKKLDPEVRKEITAKIGLCYANMNNYQKAESWFSRAVKLDENDPELLYRYIKVLKTREKYEEAIEALQKYQSLVPGDPKIQEEIRLCQDAKKWKEDPPNTRFEVAKDKFLSSAGNDYVVSFTKKGLVFTSDREGSTGKDVMGWTGQPYSDIYFSKQKKSRRNRFIYEKPTILEGDVNTAFGEGLTSFDPKERFMYYTQCNGNDGADSNCVLVVSRRKGKLWSPPLRLPFCYDSTTKVQYGSPAMSADGSTLYFVSNRPGGYGGQDIWKTTYVKRGDTWSDPVNLGPDINTAMDESFPYPYNDTTLYFSSNGHAGIGGLDIYVAYGRGNGWSKPENLLVPLNSGGDDFGITFYKDKKRIRRDGEGGYFASNRAGNRGVDDIYKFNMVPLEFTVTGVVYDKKTGDPIPNAKVTRFDLVDTSDVFIMTDDTGGYFFKLYAETDYQFESFKQEYNFKGKRPTVSTKGYKVSKDFRRDMYMDKWTLEEIKIEGIYYDLAMADIRKDAEPVLDSLYGVLSKHYYLVIELASHTDCRADSNYNMDLSQRRAESVVNYLMKKGIERERMVPKGFGERKLVNDCECESDYVKRECSDEEHQANRRTTFRVLRTDYVPAVIPDQGTEYVDPDELRRQEEEEMRKELEREESGGNDGEPNTPGNKPGSRSRK